MGSLWTWARSHMVSLQTEALVTESNHLLNILVLVGTRLLAIQLPMGFRYGPPGNIQCRRDRRYRTPRISLVGMATDNDSGEFPPKAIFASAGRAAREPSVTGRGETPGLPPK